MVAWGGSSFLFLGQLGSFFSGLFAAPLQPPGPPSREALYCPRNDPSGAKEVEWVGRICWALVGATPSQGRRTGLFSCAGKAYLMQESGPIVSRPGSA